MLRCVIVLTDSGKEGRACPLAVLPPVAGVHGQRATLMTGMTGSYRSRVSDGVVGRSVTAARWTPHEAAGAGAAGSAGVR